ncbi:hypothetical protein M2401_006025 [Pseudomonas sp. JUb42]|jgi:hypothetical protein|uniref:DUF1656 domain-containing protein n=1 Tax=Pseudomonas sp. JUb42 TaxID=2940611 RepID=UPI002168F321|nr:DUF1656 domain-containing protein [Pseudomonas sp. JUb42]MCS3472261.1 hypothetical protein [Pseudomonas sp. JUb42]
MLSEISISNLYFPPLFVYLGIATLLHAVLARLLRRGFEHAWHPGLLRFAVSVIILAVLVLKF